MSVHELFTQPYHKECCAICRKPFPDPMDKWSDQRLVEAGYQHWVHGVCLEGVRLWNAAMREAK